MRTGDIAMESWGQPLISVYKTEGDGGNLYATELYTVDSSTNTITIHGIGHRREIYRS